MKTILHHPLSTALLFLGGLTIGTAALSQVDRSTAPAPGPPPVIQIGDYSLEVLDNGLTLIVVEDHRLPRINWNLTLDYKPFVEGEKTGAAAIAGQLMRNGTHLSSKAELDEAIDFIGGGISTSANGANANSLTKHTTALLAMFSDIVLHPIFSQEEIDKNRSQSLSALAANETDPSAIASNLQAKVLYGSNHPYGEVYTKSSLEAITREDLFAFHATYFRPNIAYLVVVGDITPAEALSKTTQYFGDWEAGEVPSEKIVQTARPKGKTVCFAELPGAVQSNINIVHTVRLGPGSADAIACSVMNSVLGGGAFSGRLMQNIREDKAFTYGARSSLSADPVIGNFHAYANVRNEVTDSSIVEFLYEIERMQSELVSPKDLQTTINYMTGSFARSLENPATIARFALNIERYGLDKDYYQRYLERLAQITADDVQRVAINYLRPNNVHITVVGNADEVAETLSRFSADGEVAFFDIYGDPVSDIELAPEGMTAESVIQAYYEAAGGLKAFQKLKSMVQVAQVEAGPGMMLDVTQSTLYGLGTMTVAAMGPQVFMTRVITPTSGSMTQMGQTEALSESEIADEQRGLYPDAFLALDRFELHALLVGVAPNKGAPYFIIELRDTSDELKETLHFDTESAFLIERISTVEGPNGPAPSNTQFSDYRDFNGLKLATSIIQNAGGQIMTLEDILYTPNGKVDKKAFN
jgi:zinc protease